ncbi:hypothetical protein JCM6882_005530 [Rhodosporidiobolus microsporus]
MATFELKNDEAIRFVLQGRASQLECSFSGRGSRTLNFRELGLLANAGFNLGAAAEVVAFRIKDAGGNVVTLEDDEDLRFLRAGKKSAPSRVEVVVKYDQHQSVDVKVGIDPVYQPLTFSKATPPSFRAFLAAVGQLELAHHGPYEQVEEVYIREESGAFLKIAGEADWKRIGWRHAIKTFEDADEEGDWATASFHVGPLSSARKRTAGSPIPRPYHKIKQELNNSR